MSCYKMKSNGASEKDLDGEIDKSRKAFYSELMSKKRVIRRKFLELGSLANDHHIQTLPHRALLNRSETFLDSLNTCTDDSLGKSQTSSIEANFEHTPSSISTEPTDWNETDLFPIESAQTIHQIQTTDDDNDPEIESLFSNTEKGPTVLKPKNGALKFHEKS